MSRTAAPVVGDQLVRAAGRDQLDPEPRQLLGEIRHAGLVEDREQRALDRDRFAVGHRASSPVDLRALASTRGWRWQPGSALVERENPADLAGVGDVRVEDDLPGAVEAEIGRLAHAVLDPHVGAFPEEVPHCARGELQPQQVAGLARPRSGARGGSGWRRRRDTWWRGWMSGPARPASCPRRAASAAARARRRSGPHSRGCASRSDWSASSASISAVVADLHQPVRRAARAVGIGGGRQRIDGRRRMGDALPEQQRASSSSGGRRPAIADDEIAAMAELEGQRAGMCDASIRAAGPAGIGDDDRAARDQPAIAAGHAGGPRHILATVPTMSSVWRAMCCTPGPP